MNRSKARIRIGSLLAGASLVCVVALSGGATAAGEGGQERKAKRSAACTVPPGSNYECVVGGSVTITFSQEFKRALKKAKAKLRAKRGATLKGRVLTMPVVESSDGPSPFRFPQSSILQEPGFIDPDVGGPCQRFLDLFYVNLGGRLQIRERVRGPGGKGVAKYTLGSGFVGAPEGAPGVLGDWFGFVYKSSFGTKGSVVIGAPPPNETTSLAQISTAAPVGGNRVTIRGQQLIEPPFNPLPLRRFRSPATVATLDADLVVQPKASCE